MSWAPTNQHGGSYHCVRNERYEQLVQMYFCDIIAEPSCQKIMTLMEETRRQERCPSVRGIANSPQLQPAWLSCCTKSCSLGDETSARTPTSLQAHNANCSPSGSTALGGGVRRQGRGLDCSGLPTCVPLPRRSSEAKLRICHCATRVCGGVLRC